jgi:hypothetical protein
MDLQEFQQLMEFRGRTETSTARGRVPAQQSEVQEQHRTGMDREKREQPALESQ